VLQILAFQNGDKTRQDKTFKFNASTLTPAALLAASVAHAQQPNPLGAVAEKGLLMCPTGRRSRFNGQMPRSWLR
jgi:hypothetical protein